MKFLKSRIYIPKRIIIVINYLAENERALQFCLAIANDPDILFLDEPTVGMDFEAKIKIWKYINSIAQNKTIILTSHDIVKLKKYLIEFLF